MVTALAVRACPIGEPHAPHPYRRDLRRWRTASRLHCPGHPHTTPPPQVDLRAQIRDALERRAAVTTGEWPLLAALLRVLEYHPWQRSNDPHVPDYCTGCQQLDDGRDYLGGLPCPELTAIASALGLLPHDDPHGGTPL